MGIGKVFRKLCVAIFSICGFKHNDDEQGCHHEPISKFHSDHFCEKTNSCVESKQDITHVRRRLINIQEKKQNTPVGDGAPTIYLDNSGYISAPDSPMYTDEEKTDSDSDSFENSLSNLDILRRKKLHIQRLVDARLKKLAAEEGYDEEDEDVKDHFNELKDDPEDNKLMVGLLENKKDIENKIAILNTLDTTPEILNILVKYEKENEMKVEKYLDIVKDSENAALIKMSVTGTDQEQAYALSALYKKEGKTALELCENLEKYADGVKATQNPVGEEGFGRFANRLVREAAVNSYIESAKTCTAVQPGSYNASTYQIMSYVDRAQCLVDQLTELQKNPERFVNLYDANVYITDLTLHHVPEMGEDFTTYRDKKNSLEYVQLYNGQWQVCQYDDSW